MRHIDIVVSIIIARWRSLLCIVTRAFKLGMNAKDHQQSSLAQAVREEGYGKGFHACVGSNPAQGRGGGDPKGGCGGSPPT